MAESFDKYADYFDIRTVIERFEELESERESFTEDGISSIYEWADKFPNDAEEYLILLSFLEEVKGRGEDEQWRGDWYPVTFLHEDHFVEAMEELVKDSGDMPKEIPSYIVIDWGATAENLRADYSSVDIDGEEFWYR